MAKFANWGQHILSICGEGHFGDRLDTADESYRLTYAQPFHSVSAAVITVVPTADGALVRVKRVRVGPGTETVEGETLSMTGDQWRALRSDLRRSEFWILGVQEIDTVPFDAPLWCVEGWRGTQYQRVVRLGRPADRLAKIWKPVMLQAGVIEEPRYTEATR